MLDLDLENNPLDIGSDPKRWAEITQKFSFIPNLKIFSEGDNKKQTLETGTGWGTTRSLLAEGGVLSMFNDLQQQIKIHDEGEAEKENQRNGTVGADNGEKEDGGKKEDGKEKGGKEKGDAEEDKKKKRKRKSKDVSGHLVREFFSVEDINKAGLAKAKKEVIQQEVGSYIYLPPPLGYTSCTDNLCFQDAHCENYPLFEDKDMALFCVFDGHSGRDAATAAADVFPKVRSHWVNAVFFSYPSLCRNSRNNTRLKRRRSVKRNM